MKTEELDLQGFETRNYQHIGTLARGSTVAPFMVDIYLDDNKVGVAHSGTGAVPYTFYFTDKQARMRYETLAHELNIAEQYQEEALLGLLRLPMTIKDVFADISTRPATTAPISLTALLYIGSEFRAELIVTNAAPVFWLTAEQLQAYSLEKILWIAYGALPGVPCKILKVTTVE